MGTLQNLRISSPRPIHLTKWPPRPSPERCALLPSRKLLLLPCQNGHSSLLLRPDPWLPHQRASFAAPSQQQTRGVKTIDFAGTKEDVYERADWPREKLLDYFKNDTLALIGYGSQGHGQGLNLRDNG